MLRLLFMLFPLTWAGLKLAWRMFRDRRVPLYLKALPVIALLYALSPVDLVHDILPAVGQIDDLVVAVVLLVAFVLLATRAVLVDTLRRSGRPADRREEDAPPTVEGRFRHVDDPD